MTSSLAIGRFYGESTAVQLADAVFSHVKHHEERQIPDHIHQAPHFCLLIEGKYMERTGSASLEYEPLTVVFRPAGLTHRDAVGPGGAQFFIVELGPSWRAALAAYGPAVDDLYELKGGDASWLTLRLSNEVRSANATLLEIESLLFELCGLVAKMQPVESSLEPAWVSGVATVLDRDFRIAMDLRSLAAAAGVHPTHVARGFRRHRGCTVGDYVVRKRVQYVCGRLRETQDSIAAIAHDAGFADQSHLTRVFKSIAGTTPGAFRRGDYDVAERNSSTVAKNVSISSSLV